VQITIALDNWRICAESCFASVFCFEEIIRQIAQKCQRIRALRLLRRAVGARLTQIPRKPMAHIAENKLHFHLISAS
jgi:hypothetical protein